MLKHSISVDMSMDLFEGWKNSFIPGWVCFFSHVCNGAAISSITFLGELDALEWWERKSSDTQPSPNESIKRLPQRSCYIFKCLWEYLQFCLVSCHLPTPEEFPSWITLSARGSARCTVLWNGSLVQQVAQHGNSITFLRDPRLRFTVPRQQQRPDSDLTWGLVF